MKTEDEYREQVRMLEDAICRANAWTYPALLAERLISGVAGYTITIAPPPGITPDTLRGGQVWKQSRFPFMAGYMVYAPGETDKRDWILTSHPLHDGGNIATKIMWSGEYRMRFTVEEMVERLIKHGYELQGSLRDEYLNGTGGLARVRGHADGGRMTPERLEEIRNRPAIRGPDVWGETVKLFAERKELLAYVDELEATTKTMAHQIKLMADAIEDEA